jgi:hypothetical protein
VRHWVVAVLVASLVPLVAGPAHASVPNASVPNASVPDATEAYASWLRAQATPSSMVRAETAVDRALQTARAEAPHALDAFTEAFARAYQAHNPSVSLAELFALPAAHSAPLYRVLHQRAQHLGRAAAVSPVSWRTAVSPAASGSTGSTGAELATHPPGPAACVACTASLSPGSPFPAASLLQILSDAAPRGP